MNKKRFSILMFLFLSIFFILVLFQYKLHRIYSGTEISKDRKSKLLSLAGSALAKKDVPVGALLIYEDKIIGQGFNTVMRDNDVTGHAEINAINHAIKEIGLQKFNALNRNKLYIVTTFEPCEMCKGTLIHYNIKKVIFMKEKSLFHWWKKRLKSLRFEWNKRKTEGSESQDSLFMLHPDYPGK